MLDVTVTGIPCDVADGAENEGDTISEGRAANWVTLIVRVIPPPVTVTVAVRLEMFGLAVTFSVNEPLPVRLEGETFEMVSHDSLLVGALQVIFDVTDMEVFCAVEFGIQLECDNVRFAPTPACSTLIVRFPPFPKTVTVAVRLLTRVFAVTFILNEPSPPRSAGTTFVMVSHDWSLRISQFELDSIDTVTFCAADVGIQLVRDTLRYIGAAA